MPPNFSHFLLQKSKVNAKIKFLKPKVSEEMKKHGLTLHTPSLPSPRALRPLTPLPLPTYYLKTSYRLDTVQ